MSQYPSPHPCGACDAPAVFRYALCAPDERPAAALQRRPTYRCPACFPVGKPDYLAGVQADALDWVLVVDPAYTRDALDPRCDCGLPADHRNPLSGEPRPCADETSRIALPGASSRPPVRPALAAVLTITGAVADRAGALASPRHSVTSDESPELGAFPCPRDCGGWITPTRVHTCPDGVTPGAGR
jgi:hypothetical protein